MGQDILPQHCETAKLLLLRRKFLGTHRFWFQIHFGFFAGDKFGKIIRELLDGVGDVVNGSLVSLAANNTVLVRRVVRESFEKMGFRAQRIDIDSIAQFFLSNTC